MVGMPATSVRADHFAGWARVIRVVDGDTIVVETPEGLSHTVRIYGVDAPERGQPGFEATRSFLSGLIFGCARSRFEPLRWCNVRPGLVWLEAGPRPVDPYGRSLYYVWVELDLEPAEFTRTTAGIWRMRGWAAAGAETASTGISSVASSKGARSH